MAAVYGNGMLLSTVPKSLQLGIDLCGGGFAPNVAPEKHHHECKFLGYISQLKIILQLLC